MKKILLFLLYAMWTCNVNAQSSSPEVISTAGETYQGNSMQLDWTLGELSIVTLQNTSQQITQGFHQPYFTITSVNEIPQEIGKIEIFPNPTSDRIEMSLHFEQTRDVKIQLSDINGRVLWSTKQSVSQIEQAKSLKYLSNGNYFLNFSIDGNKYSKTFKVQKIN